MYTVRLFEPTETEYAAIVVVHAAAWPDERHHPPQSWRQNDAEWTAEHLLQRFVVMWDGAIVAEGMCYEPHWQHQPGTVHLGCSVHPAHASQGIEALLFDAMLAFLRRMRPATDTLATEMREDRAEQVAFLQACGFVPVMRSQKSALDVASFDPAPYQHLEARLAVEGVHILALAELQAQAADWREQLYELRWQLIQDVPSVEPPVKPSFAQFVQQVLDDPALDPEAWFLAVDARQAAGATAPLVGMSNLWVNDPSYARLDTGLTGVVHAYRRRHIATALKLRTITYARQRGARTIETSNEEHNPMYQLNLRLGFRPRPAWVSYRAPVMLTSHAG
jgi:GNAT superfamily N-acetyltransferase